MAERSTNREERTKPPSRNPFVGFALAAIGIILVVVVAAFLLGAFQSEDIGIEEPDTAAVGGSAAEEQAPPPESVEE